MKPHLLRIEAFGPYVEPTEIDFDALSDEGLFLIHGTTGAGKTFLLDALCFALYGEVSGDRNLKGLKSDHAEPGAVPRVGLDFSCGGLRYRVERSPAYSAPKARGQGFTEKAAQAVLFRRNGAELEPLASRSTEVSREVEQLVGLNAAQFRQVILLPQGKFAEVLRARAEEREALLKTLFNTLIFEQAGLWLEEKAKAARIALAEQTRGQEVLRRQVAQAWTPFAMAGTPLGEEGAPETPADQQDLDRLQERMGAVVAAAAARYQQASAAMEAAQGARTRIDREADRWDRRAAAIARLMELEGKEAVVADFRQRLQRAERAEVLRGSLDAEAAARLELTQLQQRLEQGLRDAERARDDALALPAPLTRLDLGTLPSQEQLVEARSALAAWRAELAVLVRQALEAAQARAAADQAIRLATAAEGSLARGAATREHRQQQRQQASEALQRACTARDQLDGLERAAREAQQRLDAVVAIRAASASRATAMAAQQRADGELHRCQAALGALRQEQMAGMASRLAGNLVAGDPCPVCGSTDHPTPAQGADGAVADAAIREAERQLAVATEGARRGAAALATVEAELKALLEQAGAAALDPPAAAAAMDNAALALKLARAQAAEANTLQAAIETHDRELQALQQVLQTATTDQALHRQAAAAAGQRALTLQAEIVRVLGEGVDPQQAQLGLDPLGAALKQLAAGAEASSGAQARLQQATGRLLQELAGTNFSDGAAVRAALKEESWRQELQKRIDTYDRELIQGRGLLASEDLADLPEQRPDTAAALDALASADAGRNVALERQSEARHANAEITRLAEEHRQGDRVLGQRQEQARLLNAVADRCLGRTAPFISLQRWVLSAYLADICRYANQRLELMTSGRYQLRLTDEGGRGGRHAGLGLRVLDAYTGEEREVSSLSGGETFQASLALALGVADTVQAHAGGVHLEALFIDEGFGTLDPDNLQLAMDELDRLRDGGRMIGVISHVGALKERIRAGIAITAAEKGSRATVCRTALG